MKDYEAYMRFRRLEEEYDAGDLGTKARLTRLGYNSKDAADLRNRQVLFVAERKPRAHNK
jgi:hypothetical protein